MNQSVIRRELRRGSTGLCFKNKELEAPVYYNRIELRSRHENNDSREMKDENLVKRCGIQTSAEAQGAQKTKPRLAQGADLGRCRGRPGGRLGVLPAYRQLKMKKPGSVQTLTDLGRVRLSRTFFMRDFLHSEIAALHGIANIPDDPDLAIAAGTYLCEELLEPLQTAFGRIAIRSAYRSMAINNLGNERMRAGKSAYNCARDDFAGHIWDRRDKKGRMGATACIVVPAFWDRFQAEGDWQRIAWWIHDHLPYSHLQFFPRYFAFNITWREEPERRIDSFIAPKGCLTRPGMENHEGSHEPLWAGLP